MPSRLRGRGHARLRARAGARARARGAGLYGHAAPARGRRGLLRPRAGGRLERRELDARAARIDRGSAVPGGVDSQSVSESTKADDIALALEDDIVSGRIEPGTVLRQEQLSARFDVSRTPTREALRRLAALGLVSFVPNRGVRVRTLARDELREAFLVRAELESLATELATSRMTASDIDQLDAAEKRFAELTLVLRRRSRAGTQDSALIAEWTA